MTDNEAMIEAVARAMADNLGIRSWEDTPVDRGDLRRRIRDRENYDVNEPNQWDYLDAATAALKALRDTLGYDPQAAFNAGLERAAVILEQRAAMYQGKAAKKDPLAEDCMNLSEGFRLCAEASEWAASDIRAEKEKPQ